MLPNQQWVALDCTNCSAVDRRAFRIERSNIVRRVLWVDNWSRTGLRVVTVFNRLDIIQWVIGRKPEQYTQPLLRVPHQSLRQCTCQNIFVCCQEHDKIKCSSGHIFWQWIAPCTNDVTDSHPLPPPSVKTRANKRLRALVSYFDSCQSKQYNTIRWLF